jgi:putative heme-binding domain-containing protein
MAKAGLKQAPAAWIDALANCLRNANQESLEAALATTRALAIPKTKAEQLTVVLLRIGDDSARPAGIRLQALAAVPGGLANVSEPVLTFLLSHLHADQPVVTRALAADVLSRARLNSEQLVALAAEWNTIAPMEVDHVLDAFVQSTDDVVGLKLVAALQASPLRTSLRAAALKPRLAKFGPKVEKQAQELYAALNADEASMRVKLDQLATHLSAGDIRRGQLVFHSQKASCFVCHAIGYRGGNVGPDLTRIGSIRSERDLLESIVFPSASFVRGYEPVVIATKSGKTLNGLVKKDTPEEIVLVTGANQEERIPRDSIEAMQPSKLSVMPSGLEQQLTHQELADLIAFLKACK